MKSLMTLLVTLMFAGFAVAQEIDPCANESGAGYGLCNAYCVAMNCDDPDLQEASFQACDKVAANYEKIVGGVLTCGVCPCFTEEEVYQLVAAYQGELWCKTSGDITELGWYGAETSYLLQAGNPNGSYADFCYARPLDGPIVPQTYNVPEKDILACRQLLLRKMTAENCDGIY